MWKRSMLRGVQILVGLWTLLQAVGELLAIPSRFASVGMFSPWQAYWVTELWLFATLLVALVGVAGLLVAWSFGHRVTVISLAMNTSYLLVLPLLDADMDPRRACPRLGIFALVNIVAAGVLRTTSRALSRP